MTSNKKKICMVVPNSMVKGGIAAVVNGYHGSLIEKEFNLMYVESYKDGGKLTKFFKGICGYLHFIKVLLLNKPDFIHIHSSFGASFYRKMPFIYMAYWARKPIINHIHGAEFEPFYLNASDKKKELIKKVYNKCSILIALSDEWKERLKLIVSEEVISVVENYSVIYDETIEAKINIEPNKQVLFLGEIGKRKGCYDIPAVIEKVVKQIPDVKFILGGTGDVELINELLQKYGVEKNVLFPGWVRGEDKDRLLKQSDIFFLPSYNEGMPMSILDAMGYGMPIVSTNVGGIPKLVQFEKNGYTLEPGDTVGFAKAIIELLINPEKLQTYGLNSYEIVKSDYSLERHLNLLKIIYNRL
ncbi:glycosyltransferase family 4 protein [Gottfriedia sp. NPDC056225]|uniref:glycosyltransferase family 4 protein n=1 Tax=Gottfriedia sp. NPDC056225 TaxID=3345751 RepID=UPI0035DD81D7